MIERGISIKFVDLLFHAHECAQSTDETEDFSMDVMDYIFHEMHDAMVSRSTIPYAPYIMLLIKDTLPNLNVDVEEHKIKKP